MDSFKNEEIQRMEKGGNNKLKEWFESQPEFYDGMTISERYSSDFAEDYKEKVSFHLLAYSSQSLTPHSSPPTSKAAPG
jgi:hypothetical protein